MRLAFMGSPDFALPSLRALHAAGHDVAAVYCQPPRPAGRGQAPRRCPVQVAAEALGLPVRTPAGLRRDAAAQAEFAALGLDAAVVAAYGLVLPQAMLDAPRQGCLNVHARLMLLAGGGPLDATTTATALHDALADLGGGLVLQALAEAPAPVPQPAVGATYAPKLTRGDGRLDWALPAAALDRRVRALNPWPGTVTSFAGEALKVLAARPERGSGPAGIVEPGTLLDDRLLVAAGDGALRILRLQAPGRAPLDAPEFLRGRAMAVGARLG